LVSTRSLRSLLNQRREEALRSLLNQRREEALRSLLNQRRGRSGSAQRADVQPDLGVHDDLLGGRHLVDQQRGVEGTLRFTTASAIGPSSWWRALDPTNPMSRPSRDTGDPAGGSRFSVPSRCSITSRRGGRPSVWTRATVSWPR
jgi:hypothetical protein